MLEQLECCALETNAGPMAAPSADKIKRVLIDDLTDDGMGAAAMAALPLAAQLGRAPPTARLELRPDQSSLWLQTARLRL
jgi:hypothetical protein